jgi:plasmid stabilization system protein ParE
MKLIVLSCAEQELADAVDYYNRECPGLGFEFAAEIQRGFRRIQEHPDAWPSFSSRSRRYLADRFPYGILYQARADAIVIGGIMHLRQNPSTWKQRLIN